MRLPRLAWLLLLLLLLGPLDALMLQAGAAAAATALAALTLSTAPLALEQPGSALITCGQQTALAVTAKINSGGGGTASAVYSAVTAPPESQPVAVKVSWPARLYVAKWPPATSADVVLRECKALQRLAAAGVDNVERCVDSCYDAKTDQASVVLAPLFTAGSNGNDPDDSAATVAALPPALQQRVARQVARTAVQMLLNAHLASRDIQLLVNAQTGDVLFIDFTEMTEADDDAVVTAFLRDARRYIAPSSLGAAREAAAEAVAEASMPTSKQAHHLEELLQAEGFL